MANKSFDQLPWSQPLVDADGKPTAWFQATWQRLADAVGGSGIVYGSGDFTSSSGVFTIPHGQAATPDLDGCMAALLVDSSIVIQPQSTDATNLTFKAWTSSTGATISNGTYTVNWQCKAA